MGLREVLDAHGTPHGAWQGARVGTLVSRWRCHLLAERPHGLVAVRDGVAERPQTCNTLWALTLRDPDGTDARLANGLTMLGNAPTQAPLERAMREPWGRVYRLPTATMRLDSPRGSVEHDATTEERLLHQGHSTAHRPDVRQCTALRATLDPLGLPLGCPPVAGHRADEGWYVPASAAAVTALGTSQVLVVGESTRGALGTRGPLVAGGRCSLGASRPPSASAAWATWRAQARARAATWPGLETVDPQTGAVLAEGLMDEWARAQRWAHPVSQQTYTWTERVRVVRSSAYQAGLQRRRERAVAPLTDDWAPRWQPPGRGRQRYRSRQERERTVAECIARAGLLGVVQTAVTEETLPDGATRGIVSAVWGPLAAWQARVERLGWPGSVTTTTTTPSRAPTLVASDHQHAREERGVRRVQTRHRHIRPVYGRDATRIAGLLGRLGLALRVLTLTAQRLRTALAARGAALAGLTPARRAQSTALPTTERVLAVFTSITLTPSGIEGRYDHHVTPLNATQRHLLALLALPDDLDEGVARPSTNFVLHCANDKYEAKDKPEHERWLDRMLW